MVITDAEDQMPSQGPDRPFVRWLPISDCTTMDLLTVCGVPGGLTIYIDRAALLQGILADLLAFRWHDQQWFIMDDRGIEL